MFIFFCRACANEENMGGFLSSTGLCVTCGSTCPPLCDAVTYLPIVATSEPGREIALSLGYTEEELAEITDC